MSDAALEMVKFLIDNYGVITTIFVVVMIAPFGMIIVLSRILSKMQNSHDKKLDNIENGMKELTGLVKGTLDVIKWVLQKDGDERGSNNG